MGRFWILSAVLLLAVGCAAGVPGKAPEDAPGPVRNLALAHFSGDMAPAVRGQVWQALRNMGGFVLADPDPGGGPAPLICPSPEDPQCLKRLKIHRAGAVLTGHITAAATTGREIDRVQREERTGLFKTERNLLTGEEKQVEIMRTVMVPVLFMVRETSLEGNFRLYGVRGRNLILLREFTAGASRSDRRPDDTSGSTWPPETAVMEQLAAELAAGAAAQISQVAQPE